MSKLTLLSALLLSLSSAHCAADLESEGPQQPGGSGMEPGDMGGGDDSGTGDDTGDGTGTGDGGDSTTCAVGSLDGASQAGGYAEAPIAEGGPDTPIVWAILERETDSAWTEVFIGMAVEGQITTLGPGSYPLVLNAVASEEECANPCVYVAHEYKDNQGQMEGLVADASAGTLEIQTLDPRLGGKFVGRISGLTVKEIAEGGQYGSCELSIPAISFDVTLVAPTDDDA